MTLPRQDAPGAGVGRPFTRRQSIALRLACALCWVPAPLIVSNLLVQHGLMVALAPTWMGLVLVLFPVSAWAAARFARRTSAWPPHARVLPATQVGTCCIALALPALARR